MIDQLDHLVRSQRRFIAHAAHELRSPLTAVSVELQHALRSARDVAAYRAAVTEALDSATRLVSLANDLLLLARVQSRAPEPTAPCSLEEIVAGVVSSVERLARDKAVRLEARDVSGSVQGVRSDLERLVRNIVENAVRHAPRDTAVTLRASRGDAGHELEVADEGPGVAKEDREKIFEPFYRSSVARSTEGGAGLGLGIAREIARAHGGDVVLAAATRGCVFRIVLPERRNDAARATDAPPHANEAEAAT
jgi:two-component system heavy metal sensor histidine kinase CusS